MYINVYNVTNCETVFVHSIFVVATKGETEPERLETMSKVDEDRKHEYPLFMVLIICELNNNNNNNNNNNLTFLMRLKHAMQTQRCRSYDIAPRQNA